MKTIQFMAVGAAAGLLVGCANEYTQTPTPPNGPSVDMSRNTSGTAGNSAYTFNENASVPQPVLTLDQLPQPCQTTIRNQIGSEPIVKIKEENRGGQIDYRVELQRQNWHSRHATLVVSADGALVADSRTGAIEEPAGADQSSSARLGPIGDEGNPAVPANPASPSPMLPPLGSH